MIIIKLFLCKYIPDMSPKSVLLFSLVWNTLFTVYKMSNVIFE